MKVLWITNGPIGALRQRLFGAGAVAGDRYDAILRDVAHQAAISVTVATVGPSRHVLSHQEQGIQYYLLPASRRTSYQYNSPRTLNDWRSLIASVRPDIMMIWGTEFTHGLAALTVADERGTPSVIYLQGLLEAVTRYYDAGIGLRDQLANLTLRDLTHLRGIAGEKFRYHRRSLAEAQLLRRCGRVIYETAWSRGHCQAIAPDIAFFQLPLSINECFYQYSWSPSAMAPHTIMTGDCSYPLKGLHILLKALALVKRNIPDVRLLVPGEAVPRPHNIWQAINQQGYFKYLNRLIGAYALESNIEFIGRLSAEQMATRMAKAQVFVMPSALENHSTTLKEAMIVGTPCIASYVGGIPEFVTHGENGLLYRFEEYEMLAGHIEKIFSSTALSATLSGNARQGARRLHDANAITRGLLDIYREIVEPHGRIER